MIPEFTGTMLTPDYKLFLASVYFAGVLTGAIIGAIVAAIKDNEKRQREKIQND
jgi:predicted acylesterase/phospholipase RssA